MAKNVFFSDSDELLDIRHDHVFKAVFSGETPASRGALSALISAFIGYDVTVASISANEPPVNDTRDRNIRFDISCKTETGELVNIEMSLEPDSCELARFEYYSGKLFTRQEIQGSKRNYGDLCRSYQIGILAGRRFFEDDALVHTFQYYDPEHKFFLGGKSRIITIELRKAELIVEKPIPELATQEAWAVFFQYLTDKGKRAKINEIIQSEGGIKMASEAIITITQEDREWARRLSEEKYILDMQSKEVTAERKGLAKGREEGLAKGREEGLREAAKNLKARGVSFEIIAQSTGLSMEEVAKL